MFLAFVFHSVFIYLSGIAFCKLIGCLQGLISRGYRSAFGLLCFFHAPALQMNTNGLMLQASERNGASPGLLQNSRCKTGWRTFSCVLFTSKQIENI